MQVVKIESKWTRSISESHPSQDRSPSHFVIISKFFICLENNAFEDIGDKKHLDCMLHVLRL